MIEPKCINNAPYFGIKKGDIRWLVIQGNCHNWNCPKCGIGRAKQEYGRLVEGSRSLVTAGETLLFLTVTTRGKELSADEALQKYGQWTSKLLDAMYSQAKRAGVNWHYAQVTELQKRGHPHSHILTSWNPIDGILGVKYRMKMVAGVKKRVEYPTIRSKWFEGQLEKSSLGSQYDISPIINIEAASRYVAGYMFKPEMFNYKFPKNWRRVRYSQSWPKIERVKGEAIPLITKNDWFLFSKFAKVIDVTNVEALEKANEMIHEAAQCMILLKQNDGLTDMERLTLEYLNEL